ncbi:hypothetical protein O181_005393 [Austropuccinia psidii MF-1]|uniref:Uncharacterized protein n=1 Tax=Austropuccinia psidii MF-1 TaxID=1389203 RepID=A0A9Q3BI61_9BASI|nr:hypothetical protein [Austropuccinia psidii MF-1]
MSHAQAENDSNRNNCSSSENHPSHPHSDAIASISNQLISAGFLRQPLPSATFNGSNEGQKLLLKAIWSMIASRTKEMSIREGLMAKQREVLYEHDRLNGFLERSNKEKFEAQQEAVASLNRANAVQKELESEKSKHRKTREDYIKLKNAERLIKTTTLHEIRKKSNELEELQKRLTKLTTIKDLPTSSLSFGPIGTIGTRVETELNGRSRLLEFDLQTCRDSNRQLQLENAQLRQYLSLYEQQLSDLISEINPTDQTKCNYSDQEDSKDEDNLRMSTSNNLTPLTTIYKQMSTLTYKLRNQVFEIKGVMEELRQQISDINTRVEQERIEFREEQDKRRGLLEMEIESLKSSLKEAESVIDGWAHTGLASGIPESELDLFNAEESLELGQLAFKMEVEAISAERKKFTEAIELGKQRAELERRKLDEERRKILKELEEELPPSKITEMTDPLISDQKLESKSTQLDKEDATLESLVVYTKPSTTNKKSLPLRTGKTKSTITKGLNTANNLKQKHQSSINSTRPPARNRTAVLKSLLSITGEEGKISNNVAGPSVPNATTAATRSSPRRRVFSTTLKSAQISTTRNSNVPKFNAGKNLKTSISKTIRPQQKP